ncbi:MAG: hypothetical protein ACYDD1_20040 [Caulobacteraceae bacterium]
MNKTIRAAGLGLAVSLFACAALAQAPATKVAHDGAGASFNLAGQTDAAGAFHYRDLMEGVTSAGVPIALAMDPAGIYLGVDVEALPPITFASPQHVIVDSQTASGTAPTLANQQQLVANTAPIAGQAMTAISSTATTNGVALAAGARGTEILLPTSSATLTFAIEATATCGAAAPGDSITLAGPAVFDIPLASGVVVCETAATAAHSRGF